MTPPVGLHRRRLVRALGEFPWVWFGVSNEPESNFAGAQDAQVGALGASLW